MEEESSKAEPTTSCGSTAIWVRLMTCVGILERVGRPSRPAPRRPTTAVWLTQPPGALVVARRGAPQVVDASSRLATGRYRRCLLLSSFRSQCRRPSGATFPARGAVAGICSDEGGETLLLGAALPACLFRRSRSGAIRAASASSRLATGRSRRCPPASSRSRHAAGDPQTSRFLHVARSPAPWRPSGVTFPSRGAVARPAPPTDGRPTYGVAPVGGLTTATRRWSRSRFR